jgi:hypothetical protein
VAHGHGTQWVAPSPLSRTKPVVRPWPNKARTPWQRHNTSAIQVDDDDDDDEDDDDDHDDDDDEDDDDDDDIAYEIKVLFLILFNAPIKNV